MIVVGTKRSRSGFPFFLVEDMCDALDDPKRESSFGDSFDLLLKGSMADGEAVPKTPILVTEKLRGVVHELSQYEFEMRAYPIDLSWEQKLWQLAFDAWSSQEQVRFEEYGESDKATSEKMRSRDSDLDEPNEYGALTWIREGSSRLTITVDEFSLVHVASVWTKPVKRFRLQDVFREFQTLLDYLSNQENRKIEVA